MVVRISRLFAESEELRDCSFVKAGKGARIERRGTKAGHQYDLLGHSMKGDVVVEPLHHGGAHGLQRVVGALERGVVKQRFPKLQTAQPNASRIDELGAAVAHRVRLCGVGERSVDATR